MKRILLLGLILAFIFVVLFLANGISDNILEQKEKEFTESSISIEKIELIKSHHYKTDNSTILTLFHPSCDFCQAEAGNFRTANNILSDYQILWVSYDEKDSIRKFSKNYGLDTLSNMHFAYMDIEAMLERYGNVKFPTFLAYNEKGQLIKKFVGLTKPEEILNAYQEP